LSARAPEPVGRRPGGGAPAGALDPAQVRDVLTHGEFEIEGRLTNASNATLFGRVTLDGVTLECVHKPVAGERPLWDFPDGTLAGREVAAFEVSETTGWRVVPPTVMRQARWGPGMCQLWIEEPDDVPSGGGLLTLLPEDGDPGGWCPILGVELGDGRPAVLAHRDDDRLRRIAAFDVVVNNADRKGGHLLVGASEPDHVYGIDHGVTFHVEDKLRTLLWGFDGEPLGGEVREVLAKLEVELESGALAGRLAGLVSPPEVAAARDRVRGLLRAGSYPGPDGRSRPVPWPPI
jgi:uncharacterized repeat protein (TIGR03843 family)